MEGAEGVNHVFKHPGENRFRQREQRGQEHGLYFQGTAERSVCLDHMKESGAEGLGRGARLCSIWDLRSKQ